MHNDIFDAQRYIRCTTIYSMHNDIFDAQRYIRCTTIYSMHNDIFDAQRYIRCTMSTGEACTKTCGETIGVRIFKTETIL